MFEMIKAKYFENRIKGVQIKEDQRKKGLGSQLKEVKGKRNVPSEIANSANFTVQIQLKE